MKNLYDSHYDKLFIALGELFRICAKMPRLTPHIATLEQTHLKPNRILAPHTRYYIREMRILAYNQLLESYRSLTLESLARSFGMSIDFVDKYVSLDFLAVCGVLTHRLCSELSRFIASGRLHCTIDKVNGVVETNRPSLKNAQYETVVRQGDILLNAVQRLSKVLY